MIRPHLRYLSYVLRHKWYVFRAGRALGVPLHQLIVHDWTKFLPREWNPYVRQFFNADGSTREVRDASGAYDPNAQPNMFKRAWLSHQRNLHHWQAWVSIGSGGSLSAVPMPERFAREMVADWSGAGLAQGHGNDVRPWYQKIKDKMILHPETRVYVEQLIQTFGWRS